GNCCSQYGWCGKTTAYCGHGCQKGFGKCNPVAPSIKPSSSTGFRTSTSTEVSSVSSARPSPTQPVSANARCGPSYGGRTCLGSKWGSCCSQ
ncbi:hypothetical protein BKA66DRAFT_543947, partial [Pyrenochaeta sp. MPI-SDFR-AT-0127]